ncbi:hypothetical protein [Bradyrhizobium sp. AUGA SZCCT0283]|uniref:hypothetical protein n=1 Tax=Bradyrhizobium sp. AUGA SZCCT0283 TaxID=2807671 RepID=UPI001BA7B416|nr:hypothetical protein [Bradyrhizobium sp. AUGA SZCCT0283]MBR1273122.1 hypothetical protein [Bradyrhizobium sp. AUGA SZCCT0283]
MSARTDALVSQQEAGKIAASIILRCGRLPPDMSGHFNARGENMFPKKDAFPRRRTGLLRRKLWRTPNFSETLRNIRSRVLF